MYVHQEWERQETRSKKIGRDHRPGPLNAIRWCLSLILQKMLGLVQCRAKIRVLIL